MSFSLKLARQWESQGWKVKVRDRERLEPPHVTILHRTRSWRWDLREQQFLDTHPDPAAVPVAIMADVRQSLEMLRRTWNRMYPENPISSEQSVGSTNEH